MVNAKYRSKIDLILPIKLSNVMSLNLKNLGCLEFKLEHVEKQEFLGWVTVEVDIPNSQVAYTKISKIVKRMLHVMSIVDNVRSENLKIHKPELMNPEDFESVEKVGISSIAVSVNVARPITNYKDVPIKASLVKAENNKGINKIETILLNIENYPSKESIYLILETFDEFHRSSHENKLVKGWELMDLFIIQSRKKGIGTSPLGMLKDFVSAHIPKVECVRIISKTNNEIASLSSKPILSLKGTDRTLELKNSLTMKNTQNIIRDTLICIYEVRNKKLHRKKFHDLYDVAVRLLEVFLSEIWEIRLKNKFIQK